MTSVSNKMYAKAITFLSQKNELTSEILLGNNCDLHSEIFISPLKHNKMFAQLTCIDPELIVATAEVTQDAYIKDSAPTMNFGSSHTMYIADSVSKGSFKTFIQFNIPKLDSKFKIKQAILCFTSVEINKPMKFSITALSSEWKENNITWKKYPTSSSLHYTTPLIYKDKNIEIDVTSYTKTLQEPNIKNYGIMLESITDDAICGIYSKESISPPYIKILYYDSSEKNINTFDLTSEITISSSNDLNSELIVKASDNGLLKDLECEINIINPNLSCEIEILPNNDMISEITISQQKIDDLECNIFVSNPNILSEIYIPYTNDLSCEIDILKLIDLPCEINIIKNDMVNLNSELIVCNCEELECEINIINKSDLNSELIVCNCEELECEINIINTLSLECEVVISNPNLITEIIIPEIVNLDCEINIQSIGINELQSEIIINKIVNDDLESEIIISNVKDLNCEIYIPYNKDLESEIYVPYNKDLNCEIYVKSPVDLDCEIIIPNTYSLESEIIILERAINEIISFISVSNDRLICEIEVEAHKKYKQNYVFFM